MPLTVGTAGHIDHGKTWLVRALTGKDTDRLPEEQARGISIDLGYAPLELPDGRRMSLVDVPGHERFVRAMVAGASGIDLFLLVIDAREGARPQTHEHLAVLRLLGVDRGVVAITKVDAVDEETVALAVEEARELVPDAEVVPVSAKTGAGLDELREALARVPVQERDASSATRLWVDRVFSLPGAGTIATGTLWSGAVSAGDVLRVEPRGLVARVRNVQVHDAQVERAEAGQRVAVNLPSLRRGDLVRGDELVAPDAFPVSYRLDVRLDELEPVPAAVTVHLGTKAIACTRRARRAVRPAPAVGAGRRRARRPGDPAHRARRSAGALVLDPAPPRRLDPERLAVLERGDPTEIVRALVRAPVTEQRVAGARTRATGRAARRARGHAAGRRVLLLARLAGRAARVRSRSAGRARRVASARPGPAARRAAPAGAVGAAVVDLLEVERRDGKAYLPGAAASLGARAEAAAELESRLAGDEVVRVDDRELAAYLEQAGRLRRVGDGLAVSAALYDRGRELLPTLGEITLPGFRDALGVGRRTAQLLLERYDADGITRRRGDVRVLRRT